jgi:hypothetical protein
MVKNRWLLEDLASPLRDSLIAQITPPEVLGVLRRNEAKGAHESAQRAAQRDDRVFRFGIATGRVTSDPTAALAGALVVHRVRHHPRSPIPWRSGNCSGQSMVSTAAVCEGGASDHSPMFPD